MAFSYGFFQKSRVYVIPDGFYLGAVTLQSFFTIYRSFKATAWDYIVGGNIILIIPVIIGLLAFTQITKFKWVARYPTAILSGISIGALWGLSIRGQLLAPITQTIAAAFTTTGLYGDPITRILTVMFFVPTIAIFMFSTRFGDPLYKQKWGKYLTRWGQLCITMYLAYHAGGAGGGSKFLQSEIKVFTDLIAHLLGF
jgi:hypothetical protein